MVEMLIAGERTAGEASEALDVVDPATEETLESVPRASAKDVDSAVSAAARNGLDDLLGRRIDDVQAFSGRPFRFLSRDEH